MWKLCLLCLILASTASLASAEIYSNPAEHFSLTVPDGWTKLSDSDMAAINSKIVGGPGTPHFEAAYRAGPELPYPGATLLIGYTPGYIGLLPDYAAGVRHGAQTAADRYRAQNTGAASFPDPDVTTDEVEHTVTLDSFIAIGAGTVQTRCRTYLGQDGAASVSLTDLQDRFTLTGPILATTLASFHFDQGHTYADKPTPTSAYEVGYLAGKIVSGLLILALVCVIAWQFNKSQKR
jgi:hypothetical protein